MATSPYRYYLDVISNWPTAIAVENQWFVWMDLRSVGVLKNNLSELVNSYDVGSAGNLGWNVPTSTVNKLISKENQDGVENLIGCVFATSVKIPSERVDIKHTGLSYGGYQSPATASSRDPYKELSISFMETNSSFIDFVIRPWIVAVSYFGLIARSPKSEKKVTADYLDVVYIGRTGPYSPSIKRKIIRFFGVVPKSVDGGSNQYASVGASLNISVTFAYDYYIIIDPTSQDNTAQNTTLPSQGNSPASKSTTPNTENIPTLTNTFKTKLSEEVTIPNTNLSVPATNLVNQYGGLYLVDEYKGEQVFGPLR